MPREKSAGIIIYRMENNEPHYLLLHYAPSEKGRKGHWGFTKGHVEKGETDEQTARRETAEETGIKELKIIPGFKRSEKYFFKRVYGLKGKARENAPWVFKLVIFFLAQTQVEKVQLSHEHIGYVWLPYREASKKITFKNSKELLKRANDFVISKKGFQHSQKNPKGQGFDLQTSGRVGRKPQGIQGGREHLKQKP
jgi:8-oxo-dGTP pyrophosphatase MutT (NUDIX family)